MAFSDTSPAVKQNRDSSAISSLQLGIDWTVTAVISYFSHFQLA